MSGGPPLASTRPASSMNAAELRDVVDERAERRPLEQDVVDLSHQVPSGRVVADRPAHLREVQSHTDRERGQHERAASDGPASPA